MRSTAASEITKYPEDIIRITIHFCDKLNREILLTQPVVCMHIVNADDGSYIKKLNKNRAAMSFYENQRSDVDYIMPIMTQPCNILPENPQYLSWEESFIVNESFEHLLKKELNAIVFFEVMDLIPMSYKKHHYERLNQNGVQKIAWAFLKVLGSNGIVNTGSKLRLQLHKPYLHQKSKKSSKTEVFQWWSKFPRIPLPASLYVSFEPHATFTTEPVLRSMLPLQQEIGVSSADHVLGTVKESPLSIQEPSKCESGKMRGLEDKWLRKENETCKVPTKFLHSLDSINNCQIMKFSISGRMLLAGCGALGQYYLLVYEVSSGNLVWKKRAHSEVIYDVDWSENDNLVVSASGDYSVKLWNVKSWNFISSFVHPSFVYSAKFKPTSQNIVVTACYDHIIRFWTFKNSVQMLQELEAHNNPVNMLCWYKTGMKLLSADCSGHIKVWKTAQFGAVSRISSHDAYVLEEDLRLQELEGISINNIIPDIFKDVGILFCSDSVVRLLDFSDGRVLSRYDSVAKSHNVCRGCCSPCGNMLFLSKDDGTISVLNRKSFEITAILPNIVHSGSLSCLEYNPRYHMLAVSAWEDSAPINIYVFNENDMSVNQKMADVAGSKGFLSDEFTSCASNPTSLKKAEELLKNAEEGSGAYKEEIRKHMYNTEETGQENFMYMSSKTSDCDDSPCESFKKYHLGKERSESLTAVITKSGQFDVIAIADNQSESDNYGSTSQSSMNHKSSTSQKSSKRSLRRKKLKELKK